MPEQEVQARPLEYQTPAHDAGARRSRLVVILLSVAAAVLLLVLLLGGVFFTWASKRAGAPAIVPAGSPAPVPAAGAGATPASVPGFAPELGGGGDADYEAARAATVTLLDDLLAGRRDDDPALAPIARQVKGYRSWSVTSQRKSANVPGSWTFGGTLAAPGGMADFGVMMVRQRGGEWAVASFRGPDRK